MNSSVIFMDQCTPDGRTIRYNVDRGTRTVALQVTNALLADGLLEIPNEDGGEPLFINPERVVTIAPAKED